MTNLTDEEKMIIIEAALLNGNRVSVIDPSYASIGRSFLKADFLPPLPQSAFIIYEQPFVRATSLIFDPNYLFDIMKNFLRNSA